MFYRNYWLIIVWTVTLTFQMESIAEEDRKSAVKTSEPKKNLQQTGVDTEFLGEIVRINRPKPSNQEKKEAGKEKIDSSQTVTISSR